MMTGLELFEKINGEVLQYEVWLYSIVSVSFDNLINVVVLVTNWPKMDSIMGYDVFNEKNPWVFKRLVSQFRLKLLTKLIQSGFHIFQKKEILATDL